MSEVIDYTHCFSDSLLVQGKESNVLMLFKLDRPFKRCDGKLASYELSYRWLSTDCQHDSDQAWACVQGSEVTYWQEKEIRSLLRQIKRGSANLFNRFTLFG